MRQDPQGEFTVDDILVESLAPGSEVLLANLAPEVGSGRHEIRLVDNAGRIVLDGVRPTHWLVEYSLDIEDCSDVVIHDSSFRGWNGYWDACTPGDEDAYPAMSIRGSSRVTLYGSELTGGIPTSNTCYGGSGKPVPAILAQDEAWLFTAGCTLEGGWGWSGDPVVLEGAAVHVESTAPSSALIGPWLGQAGQVTNLRVQGPAGDRAILLWGAGTFRPFDSYRGVLRVHPTGIVHMGTIPASGLLTFPFPQPDLPPGSEAEILRAQVLLSTPASGGSGVITPTRPTLTNPKVWVLRR